MKLRYTGRTNVGQKREINEDSFGPETLGPDGPAGHLIVLCDGMGGHAYGEVASRLGVDTILSVYYQAAPSDRPAALQAAFEEANRQIFTQGRGNMGTTGVAALLCDDGLYIANVGDSRAYLVHDGAITQISRDHSLVAEQVLAGLMTPEQARVSTIKNFITRALGHQIDVQVDLFPLPARVGDLVVLSSDGLHGLVEDEEILEAVTLLQPEQATETLIQMANDRGGSDNITVMVARIERLDAAADLPPRTEPLPEPVSTPVAAPVPSVERPLTRSGLMLSLFTLLLLIVIGAYALVAPNPNAAPSFTLTTPSTTPATTAIVPTATR
jgi:protein phosphatase